MIQLFSNTIGQEEIDAVVRVLKTPWLGFCDESLQFEKELAYFFRVPRIWLFNSATSAIYCGLRDLGVAPGDEVIVSSVNFVACANAVIDLGAIPIFADVHIDNLNIVPSEIKRLRTKDTRAVIVLHYGGHLADMDAIREASEGLLIVEDAANAPLSFYGGRPAGTLGDMGVWSFDAMKQLVMGDGGALYLKSPKKVESYRYLGLAPKSKSGIDSYGERERWWEFDVVVTSGRYISNDILSAIGRQQLPKLVNFGDRRRQIWNRYKDYLPGEVMLPPEPLPNTTSSYYLFWIQTPKRDQLARFLVDHGVYCSFRYYPLHLIEFYGCDDYLVSAESASRITLNLPIHQNMSDEDVDKVCALVKAFFR